MFIFVSSNKTKKAMSHVLRRRHVASLGVGCCGIRGIHCQKQCPIVVVVVSAFAGVTNMLLEGNLAGVKRAYSKYQHIESIGALFRSMDAIHRNFGTCDYLTSFGEKLSVEVLNVELGGDTTRIYADSSGIVLMDDDETLTVSSHFAPTVIVVVTGYCGRRACPRGKLCCSGVAEVIPLRRYFRDIWVSCVIRTWRNVTR